MSRYVMPCTATFGTFAAFRHSSRRLIGLHSVMMSPCMFIVCVICMWLNTFIPDRHAFARPRCDARTHVGARRPQPDAHPSCSP
eukprot:6214222-Pleurochrysis_carterae.AAC.3